MLRGVTLGILVQYISVVGYLMIANVTSIKSEVFRTDLMIAFAGIVASIAMGYTVLSGQQRLAAVRARDYVYIAIGSILVMFVAQVIYFVGVQAANMTTIAYRPARLCQHPDAPDVFDGCFGALDDSAEEAAGASELFHLTGSKAEDMDVVLTVDEVDVEKQRQALDCYVTCQQTIEAAGARRNIPCEAVFEI
jgi:hypothetical protein